MSDVSDIEFEGASDVEISDTESLREDLDSDYEDDERAISPGHEAVCAKYCYGDGPCQWLSTPPSSVDPTVDFKPDDELLCTPSEENELFSAFMSPAIVEILEKLVIGGKCTGKIRSIGQLSALTYLEINVGASLSDTLIRSIGLNCPKLKGLHLTDPYGMSRLSDKSGLRYLAHLTNLERLALNEVHWLSDSSLKGIADNNPKLKSLSLAICINITDNSLVHVISKCNQLKALDISGLQLATTKTLLQVQRNVNKMEKRHLSEKEKDTVPLFQLWRRNCKELWENTNPWLSIYQ